MTAGGPPSDRNDHHDPPATTDDEGWGKAADEVRGLDGTISDEDAWLAARNTARMKALDGADAAAKPAAAPAPDSTPAPASDSTPPVESAPAPEPAPAPAPTPAPEPAPAPEPELAPAPAPTPAPAPERISASTKEPTAPPAKPGGKDDIGTKRRGRGGLWVALLGLMAAGAIALVILGARNSRSYYLHCDAEHIVARRGRAFPPWGQSRLSDPQWAPIPTPDACNDQVFATEEALRHAFRAPLVAQAEAWITTERPEGKAHERIDEVQAQLEQALMLSQGPESEDVRAQVERLLGDLDYWRGQDEITAARERLEAAAAHFQEARERNPRHAGDVAAWQQFIEQMRHELGQGPPGSRPVLPAAPDTPDALVLEMDTDAPPPASTGGQPDSPHGSADAGTQPMNEGEDAGPRSDAPPDTQADTQPDATLSPPPDAGVSRRGNLI